MFIFADSDVAITSTHRRASKLSKFPRFAVVSWMFPAQVSLCARNERILVSANYFPGHFSQVGEFLCTAGRSGIGQFAYFAPVEQPLRKPYRATTLSLKELKMPDGNRLPSA